MPASSSAGMGLNPGSPAPPMGGGVPYTSPPPASAGFQMPHFLSRLGEMGQQYLRNRFEHLLNPQGGSSNDDQLRIIIRLLAQQQLASRQQGGPQ